MRAILYPEFALLKGDIVLAMGDRDGAEVWFQRVFAAAEQLGLRMPQLRAATRLTRLSRVSGSGPDTSDALRDVLATFTEGFGTSDLMDARAVLEEVDTRVT